MAEATLRVEVALAQADFQRTGRMQVAAGTTVIEIARSWLRQEVLPEAWADPARLGIFSHRVSPDSVPNDGDRIEIYRALRLDPRQARRQRAGA